MKITCALSTDNLKALGAVIYKDLEIASQKNEPYDLRPLMIELYNNLVERQDPDSAIVYLQQVPFLAGQILFRLPELELVSDFDERAIRRLSNEFRDSEKGILAVMNTFNTEIDPKSLASIAAYNEDNPVPEKEVEVTQEPIPDTIPEKRLKVRLENAISLTWEEFIEMDPTKNVNEIIESLDRGKMTVYNTISRLRGIVGDTSLLDDVVYDNVKLKLKPILLKKLSDTDLYPSSAALLSRLNYFNTPEGKTKQTDEVKPVGEHIVAVLTDEKGNFVYFDAQGKVTTKEDGGRLVYQMMRDVRKKGDVYSIRDIYDREDQILSADKEAFNQIKEQDYKSIAQYEKATGRKFQDLVDDIETEMQRKFKEYYDFREKIIKTGNSPLMTITGASRGVFNKKIGSRVNLNNLNSFYPEMVKRMLDSIIPLDTAYNEFEKGRSLIEIEGERFQVDRPDISVDLATKIGIVLTDKDLSNKTKYDFAMQFLSNDMADSVKRHTLIFKNGVLTFKYNQYTEKEYLHLLKSKPDLKNNEFQVKLNNGAAAAEQIKNILLSGKSSVKTVNGVTTVKNYPAKMNINADLLKSDLYFDLQDGDFVVKNYKSELLPTLDATIYVSTTKAIPLFNSYIKFAVPDKFTETIDKVKEEQEVVSDVRMFKNNLVNIINSSETKSVTGKVTYFNRGLTKDGKPFAYFLATIDGQEGKHKFYYPNKDSKDTSFPGNGADFTITVEDVISEGRVYPNTVVARRVVNGKIQELGKLQDTDYKVFEKPIEGVIIETETAAEETEEVGVEEVPTPESDPVIEDSTILNPDIQSPTDNTSITSILPENDDFKLDRRIELPNNVTDEQVTEAYNWWKNSPLAKYIQISHAANLVNSDVYARFIAAGANLLGNTNFKLDTGKLGVIAINSPVGGNYADVYHESWHVFSQLFLTKDEKTKLYNEVRNSKKEYSNYTNFDIEELLAEQFRDYALNPKPTKGSPVKNTLFRKILNFLKALLGKLSKKDLLNPDIEQVGMAQELFEKLYFASNNPSLLNVYTPLIDNVQWDLLNRGVETKKQEVLSSQDSRSLTTAIDSALSEIIDASNKKRNSKSGTIKIISDNLNRDTAYGYVKDDMIEKLKNWRTELNLKPKVSFDNIDTLKELNDNAIAILTTKKGDNKYVYLKSQIESFKNITADTKKGDRVKGKLYRDNIEILGDFYEHDSIMGLNEQNANIIIVDSLEDAKAQYDSYKKAKVLNVTGIIINFQKVNEAKSISYKEQMTLDNIRIFETALKNWDAVLKYHKEKSNFDLIKQKYVALENDPDSEAIEDTTQARNERYADKEIGKFTLEQMASDETVFILKSLFKKKKKGTDYVDVFDRFGYKQLADFRGVWNAVVRATNSTKDPQVMYNRLVEASRIYPELQQLVNSKIPNPSNSDNTNSSEFDITTAFFADFSRPRIPYLQLYAFLTEEGFSTEVTEASIDISNTVRRFQAKFRSDKSDSFIEKNQNISRLNLEAIIKNFGNEKLEFKDDNGFRFLRNIGFYFDDLTPIKSKLNDVSYRSVYHVNYIYDTIKQIQAASKIVPLSKEAAEYIDKFRMDPIGMLREGIPPNLLGKKGSLIYDKGISQKTSVDRIIELQNKYGKEGSGFSVLNAERNKVQEHTDDNTATVIADGINRAQKLSDLWIKNELKFLNSFNPDINPYTKRLQIYKTLFDSNGVRRSDKELEIMMVSGTQVRMGNALNEKDDDIFGTSTTNLDGQGKFLQDFHTLLKSGVIEFLRPGSKSSSFGMRLKGGFIKGLGENNEPYLYADIDNFIPSNNREKSVIERVILPYLAGETERINKFKSNPETKNYLGYNRVVNDAGQMAGETFAAFQGILNEETQKEILTKVNDPFVDLIAYLKTDTELKDKIVNEIKNYFDVRSNDVFNQLTKAKYVDPKLLNKLNFPNMTLTEKEQILSKAYMYNYWIHSFETSVLYLGDIAQYNHLKEELHKRTSGLISNGPRFRTDLAAQIFMKSKAWTESSYAATLPAEYQYFNYDGTFNTAVIQDVARDSVYLDIIREALTKDYNRRYNTLPTAEKKAIVEKRVGIEIEKYTKKEIKEGDGQGYITIDAYRNLKKLQKSWTPAQENLFQKIINNKEITAAEYAEFFPPYKLQYFGALQDTDLPVTAFHKFALMPLIPSMIAGNNDLNHLHKEMMRENIQYLTFESGSKVGTVTSNGKQVDSVYEEGSDQKKLKDKITFTPNRINVDYLKEVTTVPSKFKGKTIFSTQLRKLILEGLFVKGELVNKNNKAIVDNYTDLVKNITEVLKLELLEEIGYSEVNGKYIGKPDKFLKIIQDNLEQKDMPSHLIETLRTNKDGSLRFDLSNFIDAKTIERTILSIVEKRFVKQKLNGESLVQVASSMTNGMWGTGPKFKAGSKEDVLKYMGTNNLPFYYPGEDGKTRAMKVAIALQGDFLNLLKLKDIDGQVIGTRKRLNEMIKNDDWMAIGDNRKAVTITAVRIPVQGLNSMEFMEVWEFMDEASGNIIIPPTELVAKSGGDFDVDKLTTFMPNIGEDGYITSDLNSTELLKSVKEMSGKGKLSAIRKTKKILENQMINSIRSILELPENYANLVRPNDTYILKELSDELSDKVVDYDRFQTVNKEKGKYNTFKGRKSISATTTLEPLYNIYKFNANMIGKAVLGIGANENAFSPLFNSIGAKMPLTYKESFYDEDINKQVDLENGRTFKTRLLVNHNKFPEGNISLSDTDSFDSIDKIADLFSQGMNGWVDVEKDDWIFYIQGNLEISPTLLYLLKAGVPVREAVFFVSQPLVRQYAEQQRLLRSSYAELIGIAPEKPQFAQYQASVNVIKPAIEAYFNRKINQLETPNNEPVTVYYWEKVDGRSKRKSLEFKTDGNITSMQAFRNAYKQGLIEQGTDVNRISYYDSKTNKNVNLYMKPEVSNARIYDSAVDVSSEPGVLNGFGQFDPLAIERLTTFGSTEDKYSDLSLAAFLHFLEIEKYLKGIGNLKRRGKPENTVRSVQELLMNDLDLEYLESNSKVDEGTQNRLLKNSVISSLADKKILLDIIAPMFQLRNSDPISNYIKDAVQRKVSRLAKKYGGTNADAISKFIDEYKDAVSNFIFQNFLSNNLSSNGSIVLVPETYKGSEVIIKSNINSDVEITNNSDGTKTLYVNKERVEQDFKDKMYLSGKVGPNSYKERGLEPFAFKDDSFPTLASYYKYVIEREHLSDKGVPVSELNKKALLNTFNYNAIMRPGTYSYTTDLLDMIEKYRDELSIYPVINQLSQLSTTTKYSLLTLNDVSLLDAELGDIYAQNIRELGNSKIKKLEDTEANQKLSVLFHMLPLIAVYQHGVGKPVFGFNQAIPQDLYLSVMNNASDMFINNYLTRDVLDLVFDKLTEDKSRFKDYLVTPDNYSEYKVSYQAIEEVEEVIDEEVEANVIESNDAGYKFTFRNGYEVQTPFVLNSEQRQALLNLEDFENDPQKYNNEVTVVGYAGTGKTTIMKLFNDYYEDKHFMKTPLYSAPTHRANAVTKLNNPKVKVFTLHQLFGFTPEIEFENMDYDIKDLKFAAKNRVLIKNGDLLIIDESSMITDDLYDYLYEMKKKYNLKLIYLGDPAQLGPVQKTGAIRSKVFDNPGTTFQLTKVERTGDNPILKESTAVRMGGDLSYASDEINGKGVEYISDSARENQVIATKLLEMKKLDNPLYFRILAATNPKVKEINTLARNIIFGEKASAAFLKGDILMGYNSFGVNYKTKQALIYNSGDYEITDVSQETTKSVSLPRLPNPRSYKNGDKVTVSGYYISLKNILDPNVDEFTIFVASPQKDVEQKTKLADAIHEINLTAKTTQSKQDQARMFDEASKLAANIVMFEDVSGSTEKSKIKKTLDYGYAHTIHKSQGGTYVNVMIYDNSIPGLVEFIKNKRGLSDDQASEMMRQLRYVAVSRATDYVYISTNKNVGKVTASDIPTADPIDADKSIATFDISSLDNPPAPINEKKSENISDFTMTSGGAYGADTFWDMIGRDFGLKNVLHFREASNANLSKQLKAKGVTAKIITPEELEEGYAELEKVFNKKFERSLGNDLKARNYLQVKNADAVYAIATVTGDNKSVEGGTNAAIQMAIAVDKPVYVWDINTEKWHKYSPEAKQFVATTTPILTKNFAGIGSRDIEKYNVFNKQTNKWEERKYSGVEKETAARKAIRDVFEKTSETLVNNKIGVTITDKTISDVPERVIINLQPDNRDKIANGTKTTTIRTQKEFEYIGLPIGATARTMINGVEFEVTNRGPFTIDQVGKEAILKSEGLTSAEEFKFPTSKRWFEGSGIMYVYDFKPAGKVQTKVMPSYIIDNNLVSTATNGQPVMAKVRDGQIYLNPVKSVDDFFEYFEGNKQSTGSDQKKLVLDNLEKRGWPIDKIKRVLNTKLNINAFLVLHEQDHIDHDDVKDYYKKGRDLNTPDKIEIETRATVNALNNLIDIYGLPEPKEEFINIFNSEDSKDQDNEDNNCTVPFLD